MSDTSQDDWAEEMAPPPKKKGLPGWLLFCGGGCLIFMVLAVIGGFLLFGVVKDAVNPEIQWASLEQEIEIDARPNEMRIMGGGGLAGTRTWMLSRDGGFMVTIIRNSNADASEREALFGGGKGADVNLGVTESKTIGSGEIMVQGRMLDFVNMTTTSGGHSQAMRMVDITPEGDAGMTVIQVVATRMSKAGDTIGDDVIREILKPFVIGPDREIYVPDGPHPQEGQKSFDAEKTFGNIERDADRPKLEKLPEEPAPEEDSKGDE